jgi:SAM-dependent methyltransferase
MRVEGRAIEWLERHTTAARSRHAGDLFLSGRARPTDRALSFLYFLVAAGRWGAYEDDGHHLAALRAGLERCRPPRAAIDVGTGTGGAAVDTSPAMLYLARRRHPGSRVELRRASAAHLPYPDGTFDLLTVLNAVPEPEELRRVTQPRAQVLAAATTLGIRPPDSPWVARWLTTGFRRCEAGEVEGGSWELYERAW